MVIGENVLGCLEIKAPRYNQSNPNVDSDITIRKPLGRSNLYKYLYAVSVLTVNTQVRKLPWSFYCSTAITSQGSALRRFPDFDPPPEFR